MSIDFSIHNSEWEKDGDNEWVYCPRREDFGEYPVGKVKFDEGAGEYGAFLDWERETEEGEKFPTLEQAFWEVQRLVAAKNYIRSQDEWEEKYKQKRISSYDEDLSLSEIW